MGQPVGAGQRGHKGYSQPSQTKSSSSQTSLHIGLPESFKHAEVQAPPLTLRFNLCMSLNFGHLVAKTYSKKQPRT